MPDLDTTKFQDGHDYAKRNVETEENAEKMMGGSKLFKAESASDFVADGVKALTEQELKTTNATPEQVNAELATTRQSMHVSNGEADLLLVSLEAKYRLRDGQEAILGVIQDQIRDTNTTIRKLEATIEALRQ